MDTEETPDPRDRLSEKELGDMLTGPTSGYEARRLAAYVYGRGDEYDALPRGIGYRPANERTPSTEAS